MRSGHIATYVKFINPDLVREAELALSPVFTDTSYIHGIWGKISANESDRWIAERVFISTVVKLYSPGVLFGCSLRRGISAEIMKELGFRNPVNVSQRIVEVRTLMKQKTFAGKVNNYFELAMEGR